MDDVDGVDILTPNAMLVGGPEPIAGRQVRVDQDVAEVRASAADGSGLHAWARSGRLEPGQGGGWLRVYVYAGPADRTAEL
jgi:hypothetical protein